MRIGRRRKKKEKQRAAWDAVAATLEAPPPVSTDDLPVAPDPTPAPPPDAPGSGAPVPPAAASPPAAGDATFASQRPAPAPSVPTEPTTAAVAPTAESPSPAPAPPAAPTPLPPPPSGPPVFRFTPTGTTEVPGPVPPAPPPPPVEPVPLTLVPDPAAPAPQPVAAEPVGPEPAPSEPVAPEPVAPEPVAPEPVAPVEASRAPEPHASLPVVVAPPAHLAPEPDDAALADPAPATAPHTLPAPTGRLIDVPRSTRSIADRMRHALDEMAQLSMRMDAWMDQAVEMRTQLLSEWDDDTLRPSYTDFVVRAVARALVQHPELNAIVRGDSIELLPRVHVGVTLPGRDGIEIPVVRDADRRTLKTIAAASLGIDDADLGPRSIEAPADQASSSGGVAWRAPDDEPATRTPAAGGAADLDTDVDVDVPASFVVASLGVYGVDAFTPIVMTPNVATLAIGRVRDATRWEGDRPTRASAMTLTLAWDHRAVDGTTAAEFLAEVRDILEQPYRLLVD